jgi:hypothetical protein
MTEKAEAKMDQGRGGRSGGRPEASYLTPAIRLARVAESAIALNWCAHGETLPIDFRAGIPTQLNDLAAAVAAARHERLPKSPTGWESTPWLDSIPRAAPPIAYWPLIRYAVMSCGLPASKSVSPADFKFLEYYASSRGALASPLPALKHHIQVPQPRTEIYENRSHVG